VLSITVVFHHIIFINGVVAGKAQAEARGKLQIPSIVEQRERGLLGDCEYNGLHGQEAAGGGALQLSVVHNQERSASGGA
jgi:hypothetical protein